MSDRFEVKTTDKDKLKQTLGASLKHAGLEDIELRIICAYLDSNSSQEDIVILAEEGQRTGFSMRPGSGEYHINVENAALISAAVFLDAIVTSGIASALLAASGKKLQAISRIDTRSGALCNYITLEKMGSGMLPIAVEKIIRSTSGETCRHPQFPCSHRSYNHCGIQLVDVEANLAQLEDTAIVQLDKAGAIEKIS